MYVKSFTALGPEKKSQDEILAVSLTFSKLDSFQVTVIVITTILIMTLLIMNLLTITLLSLRLFNFQVFILFYCFK